MSMVGALAAGRLPARYADIASDAKWQSIEARTLTSDELLSRDQAIELAAHLAGAESPLADVQAQTLYDIILRDYPFDERAQIAVGTAFGCMIAKKSGFDWARISNEYGEETGLIHCNFAMICFPINILQKRIADRTNIDLVALCDATIDAMEEMAATGNYNRR